MKPKPIYRSGHDIRTSFQLRPEKHSGRKTGRLKLSLRNLTQHARACIIRVHRTLLGVDPSAELPRNVSLGTIDQAGQWQMSASPYAQALRDLANVRERIGQTMTDPDVRAKLKRLKDESL